MKTHARLLAVLLALCLPTAAMAQDFLKPLEDFVETLNPRAPQKPRPAPEPVESAPAEAEKPVEPPPLPKPRPEGLGEPETEAEPEAPEDVSPPAAAEEPVPEPIAADTPKPDDRVYQVACPALLSGAVVGKMAAPISEGTCEAQSPLEVTALNVRGHVIELTAPITTNCEMATALADWAGEVDAYAKAALDTELAALQTGTSYMCRQRVGGDDEFVSEHGFANAIDVVGFTLADGTSVVVKNDWRPEKTPASALLRQSHGAACGRFTTVLGPEANADHEDHLHLDLGCHGKTCTAQICE